MIYNLQNENEVRNFKNKITHFLSKGKTVEMTEKRNTRTTNQNKALHLLFTIMSEQLNEMGLEYKYLGLKGQTIATRYTPNIIKEFIWRPIQIALFDIKSTTKINTDQINEIVDVLALWFAEKSVVIEFPSKDQLKSMIEHKK